ncbi:MAG: SpoIIE family protein phosphatase [Ignavibacteria bacterium]|nr:SpoIIE family protein phosphatase [Ignavibacteria bacterium]NNL20852.1 SpoIIE family protein phosphatase [Ignavibacteriaceae bacterium]
MHRVILFCLLSWFIFLFEIISQERMSFNHLTIDDGLSQSSVTCILQDRNGFMWFGTQDGLNRFDGYKFKVFKNNTSDTTSITENFIFSIYEDQLGILYIETQSGLFHKYSPRLEAFQIVNKDSVDLEKAKVNTVGAKLTESSGIVWTGGLASPTGLTRLDTNTGESILFKHKPSDPYSLSDDKVFSILRDRSGNLWIATLNGLDKFDEETGKFIHYKNNSNNPNSLSDNSIWPLFEDSQGYLWIGTRNGGLNRFDPETGKFIHYKNDPNDPASLSDNFVFSIYEDRSGLIWVGTNLNGINYFNPTTQNFEHYKHNPNNQNSLSDDVVFSMLADKRGNYWIGTKNGGLNKFNYNKKNFTHIKNDPLDSNNLASNSIQSLLEDRSGIIWIGSYSSGLNAYDPQSGKFTQYVNNPSDPNSLTDNRIYALAEDSEGNIWIGTYAGGVNKLDIGSKRFSNYQAQESDSTSLSSDYTWSLEFDHSGNLWIGTFGGGINILNLGSQTFTYFNNVPNDSTSVADNFITRLYKDSKGNMWVGTVKGLSKYISSTNSFINYNETNGLSNNTILGIVEDNTGNLWISTNNGLSKFNPESESFKEYYYEDGLQGNEFNQNAFAKDHKTGRLLFGGINGFNVIDPSNIKENQYIPPITLTAYFRYNTDDQEGKPIYEKGISDRDSILLTYKDNIATLEFAALSYYNNSKNQYRYKLEGFNENWIQLGNNRTVTFTNLSPGDYNLIVTGSNNDGLWNETGRSLYVEVTPPWWRTNIAYAIYILSFLGFLYGVRRFEIKRREQKTKLRENELQLKATEAEKRAIQIENDRKTKELEEARQLQLSMLPKELPELPNIKIAAYMRTATEVGGDYYDFIVQEDGTLNIGFGDATGHGLQAGTMVTLMKGFFTSDATKLSLKEFMNHCTRLIKEIKLGRILMSFSLARINNGKLSVTSAGMPPVYYYNFATKDTEEIVIQGVPLGAMRQFSYSVVERELKSGDAILFLTDGLPEQMNNDDEVFDYKRVKDYFQNFAENSPEEVINELVKEADDWMQSRAQDDDITFVAIKII